ncbi:MAG: phosphodiester glycosidase family protein [Candidatus Eremiobacteraeota bacterium]|nr:phosphodiester glycosidase family protein [Candidatus Eremiobacteraeota bacterium]
MRAFIFCLGCCFAVLRSVAGAALPAFPHPPAPFPQILTDALTSEFVAPGVTYAEYDLQTKDGPLAIHVIEVDLREPSVRIDTVLATDALVSGGETPSSMANRTGAVAGINGDYYDIGNTNQPLGVVVRAGQIVRTPNNHTAFAVTRDRHVLMTQMTFSGNAQVGTIPIALAGINDWPPRDGVTLLTPVFGIVPAAPNITIARLSPLDIAGANIARYRIESVQGDDQPLPRGYALAISPSALEILGTPQIGDVVTLSQTSTPSLEGFAAAVGGGPLLLHNSERYYEPDAPAQNEGRSRIPISAAAIAADGNLLLVEVDGRQPFHSVGLTRNEFTSFLIGLGAREAVSFDGGGSSAIVARKLGERNPSLRSVPSDGNERVVADGLFIYSDAPIGPPARLVVQPAVLRAFPGAVVSLLSAVTDYAGHPAAPPAQPLRAQVLPDALGHVDASSHFTAGSTIGSGTLHLQRGSLSSQVPIIITDHIARLSIKPRHLNLSSGGAQRFTVEAFDQLGFPIAVPSRVQWSASAGHIDASGEYRAADENAAIDAKLGNAVAREEITVGRHDVGFQMGTQWRFSSTPADQPGDVQFGAPCPFCIELKYDFTGAEHGATMVGDRLLPQEAIGLKLDVLGDGNGEIMRLSLINAINERIFLTIGRVNWRGWETKEIDFPPSLAVPARLHTIYVLNSMNSAPVHAAGSIAIRNVRAIVGGKSQQPAK